jgi:hypothetical protein
MKISEYTILEDAFDASFGFMLNRIADTWEGKVPDFHASRDLVEHAKERCWTEFICALEELGVELGDVEVPLKWQK